MDKQISKIEWRDLFSRHGLILSLEKMEGGNVGVNREEKSWTYTRMGRSSSIQSCIPEKSDMCGWQFGHRNSEKDYSRG